MTSRCKTLYVSYRLVKFSVLRFYTFLNGRQETPLALAKIQDIIDNSLLSYYYPRLVKLHSLKNVSLKNLRKKIDIQKIRNDNKMLTVEQRSKYVLLKNAYKMYKMTGKLIFSERTINNKRPNMCAPIHRTEAFKRSIIFRRYSIWNTLPKEWEISNTSYGLFQSKAREFVTGQINQTEPEGPNTIN